MIAMENLAHASAQRIVIEIETVRKDAGIKKNLAFAKKENAFVKTVSEHQIVRSFARIWDDQDMVVMKRQANANA